MSIQLGLPATGGGQKATATRLNDLARRISKLERGDGSGTTIGADSITGSHIAPGSIEAGNIAAGSITSDQIAAGAITTTHLTAGSITADHIQSNTIQAGHIQAGAITAGTIAAGAVTADKITAGAITASKIAAGTITATEIQAGTITASLIAANAIQAGHIQASAINTNHIQADAVTATHVAAGAITASEISAGAITTEKILAGAVTAEKITATSLSALSTNMGSITAGTITGGTFQSSSSGARVVMNSSGLFGYALDGVTKVFEINAGSGVAKFTGTGTLDSSSVVPSTTLSGQIPGTLFPPMGGTNYVRNSRGDKGTDDWTASTSTIATQTTVKRSGAQAFSVTSTTASTTAYLYREHSHADAIAVSAGQKVVLSAWVYGGTGGVGRTAQIQTRVWNGTTTVYASSTGVTLTAGWQRIVFPYTIPTGGTKLGYSVMFGPTAVGQIMYVTEIQIEDGEVVTSWIPHVDELGGEILPGSIDSEDLADGAIITSKIAAGQIVASKLYSGQIAADKIQAANIAAGAITATEIAAGAISATHIQAGAVTASKISVEWGGSNILWNASAEDTTGVGPYVSSNATITASNNEVVPFDGKQVFKVVSGSAGTAGIITGNASTYAGYRGSYGTTGTYPGYYPLVAGKQYTLSAWVTSATVSRGSYARLYWYDAMLRTVLPAPTGAVSAAVTATSSLAAGTYYYRVTAVNSRGETTGSTEISRTITAGQAIDVTVTTPTDAVETPYPVTHVRVYRSTTSGTFTAGYIEQAAVGGASVTVRDTGQALTAGTLPTTNTANTVASTSTTGTTVNTLVGSGEGAVLTTSTVRVTNPSLVSGSGSSGSSTAWTRVQITSALPAGAAFCRAGVFFGSTVAAEAHYVDGIMLEPGDVVTGFTPRADEVLPGTVGATQITPGSITTNEILAGSILADSIATNAITSAKIQAGAITSDKITVSTLSAITANMGTLTAGTITGGTVQSSADANNRVYLDSSGFYAKSGGSTTVSIPNTGNPSFTGTLTARRIILPFGSTNDSLIDWLNGSEVRGRVYSYNSGYGSSLYLEAHRGSSTYGATYMSANVDGGTWNNFRLVTGAIVGDHRGKTVTVQNDSGQFFSAGDVVADGGHLYSGTGGHSLFMRRNGYSTMAWYNDNGRMRSGNVVICNSIEVPGSGYFQMTGGSAYFQENYGIRAHSGGNGKNTTYGGWSAAHVVYEGSLNGTVYTGSYSYAAIHSDYSDRQHKENIRDVFHLPGSALARVKALRPRKYDRLKNHGSAKNEIGLIAQEIAEVDPSLVDYITMPDGVTAGTAGDIQYTISPMTLIALLVGAVQDLSYKVEELERRGGVAPAPPRPMILDALE